MDETHRQDNNRTRRLNIQDNIAGHDDPNKHARIENP